jgi:2-phospho-L-lactate/phosphoenolpyruvate guanylyltransferase
MILVPIKDLRHAKQRLASVLGQAERTALAQAMIRDVLETLASWKERPAVGVVTSDQYAAQLALQFEFRVIRDFQNNSETDAIEMATRVCLEHSESNVLVIPGDIPLITVSELRAILEFAPARGSVLVPASDGRGTNAAYKSPADLFPLRFGNDSFKPHLAAARATGHPCVILSLPGIALDIDNPEDLQTLSTTAGSTHSQTLVREWDLREYAFASNE